MPKKNKNNIHIDMPEKYLILLSTFIGIEIAEYSVVTHNPLVKEYVKNLKDVKDIIDFYKN